MPTRRRDCRHWCVRQMANWYVFKTALSALILFSHNRPAQLKVNLMPVWKPAAAAVVGIAQRPGGGEEVWPVIFSELAPVSRGECSSNEVVVPSWSNSLQQGYVHDEKLQDEEKTWRNPGYRESHISLQMGGLPSGLKRLVEVSAPWYVCLSRR